jgi:glycosyltransferase involved in cell wall biosynthesis
MSISILLLCTSWRSTDGGIQTVNRRIAEALAARGLEVHVAVFSPTAADVESAKASGVRLHDAGTNYLGVQSLVSKLKPQVVCGHAALTADIEAVLRKAEPDLILLHFLHHDPQRLETLKEHRTEKERARYERTKREVDSAANADLVIAVGSVLYDAYSPRLAATEQRPALFALDLGIERRNVKPVTDEVVLPEVQVIARTDSVAIKGLDLFARAGAHALQKLQIDPKLRDLKPAFVIRGGKEGADELAERLREVGKKITPRFDIQVRPFSTDAGEMQWNWRLARLAVMPSRAEGYGLAAVEALSQGVPVIVSSESGVGRLIREHGSNTEYRRFVWQYDESDSAVEQLAQQMIDLLADQQASSVMAIELRDKLAEFASWESAAKRLEAEITALIARRDAARVAAVGENTPEPDKTTSDETPVAAIAPDTFDDAKTFRRMFSSSSESQDILVLPGRGEEYVRIYRELLANYESHIDAMGLTLSKFRRDYRSVLPAMAAKCRIRIALLDPAFPLPDTGASIASIREREENRDDGDFRRKIASYHKDVVLPYLKSKSDGGGSLEVRLYRALPAVNLFRVDDVLAFGPYLLAAAEQETPAIFIRRGDGVGGSLFESFMRHFDEVWDHETFYRRLEDVPPEELEAWRRGDEAAVHA